MIQVVPILQVLLVGLCLWILLQGGPPERLGGIIMLSGFIGQLMLKISGYPLDFFGPNMIYLVFTGILFLVSLTLAIQSNRLWPLTFSALFLVEFSGHLSVVVLKSGMSLAYWSMTQVPIVAQALTLAIGTIAYAERQRAGIKARDWRLPAGGQN